MVDDVPLRTAVHEGSRHAIGRQHRARPDWTLLAVSELTSAAIVLFFRSMFSV